MIIWAACLHWGQVATQAVDPSIQAEGDRLSEELRQLTVRQHWAGADALYRKLGVLGLPIDVQDHFRGAVAAREFGDIASAYARLKLAGDLENAGEWVVDIENNYGQVTLSTKPVRSTDLEVNEMPFDPVQRRAVEWAIASCVENGAFEGFLPQGDYLFASQPFTVQPGIGVHLEVSRKAERQSAKSLR